MCAIRFFLLNLHAPLASFYRFIRLIVNIAQIQWRETVRYLVFALFGLIREMTACSVVMIYSY